MQRLVLLTSSMVALACVAVLFSISATAQAPTPIPSVWLQNSTPGTTQTGNVNISGTLIVGSADVQGFTMLPGATAGYVLTSDGAGVGTWQPQSGFSIPYAGTATVDNPDAVFKITNNGTGWAIWGETTSTDGYGIRGTSTATSGFSYGGFFVANSPDGRGVFAQNLSTTGPALGGRFGSASVDGRAVYATAGSATGPCYGVVGESLSVEGRGVFGLANATSGFTAGVYGESYSPEGRGVWGANLAATGAGVGGRFGTQSTSGRAVHASAAAATGATYGVYADAASPFGVGVYGLSTGTGVFGQSTAPAGIFSGVRGLANGPDSIGVRGEADSSTGNTYGVWGQSDSNDGTGVYGWAFASSGPTEGVFGESYSTAGVGVRGRNPSTSGFTVGVVGSAVSPNGIGVLGRNTAATGIAAGGSFDTSSTGGRGVEAFASASTGGTYGGYFVSNSTTGTGVFGYVGGNGLTYGVLGQSVFNYGVYALGASGASGPKTFRIDHPFDPENKYLVHYSSESPSPQNFYLGNAVTDEKGYAWVELPKYFGEINANFKYQLTVVDDADNEDFVLAKVSKEIRNNRFQIRTSVPGVKVSWRVDADRDDLWMRNNPPKDEVDKGSERGTYQHPEFYGVSPKRGLGYVAAEKRRR